MRTYIDNTLTTEYRNLVFACFEDNLKDLEQYDAENSDIFNEELSIMRQELDLMKRKIK